MAQLALDFEPSDLLPDAFRDWFAGRGWVPHQHQLALLEAATQSRSALLSAPTGGGKTLAGFLPSLVDLVDAPSKRPAQLHTLYLSPLKALSVDVARNLMTPVEEMGLNIRIEARTGDTPASRKQRQRKTPPDLLLTTPEQLALLISYEEASEFFAPLKCVIIDELHALMNTKRGDLMSLGLARLRALNPNIRMVGLSATMDRPERLLPWLDPNGGAQLITAPGGAKPQIEILESRERIPWASHSARHALPEVYERLKKTDTGLLFINTRAQSEIVFRDLWGLNDDKLAIALHHGSLAVEHRRKVEAAMVRGDLRAVVCTSTLDLGIDWGDVDLVVQMGAPKGSSRLIQRVGRANHRMDEPSNALLVPANRFEFLEAMAALEAVEAGELDEEPERPGALDALAQHIWGVACAGPFDADALYAEIMTAPPYAGVDRQTFDRVIDFIATGGYALRAYENYQRIAQDSEGRWAITQPQFVRQYRMNVGTIVESPMLYVRKVSGKRRKGGIPGRKLGMIEESLVSHLAPGDGFLFGGQLLRFEGIEEMSVVASPGVAEKPRIPVYGGAMMPLSTRLADRVRGILADVGDGHALPEQIRDWLRLQRDKSALPPPDRLLVETFPRGDKYYMVAYPFEGRPAHQTFGVMLTRRMETFGLKPLGFVASDYAIAAWGLRPIPPSRVADLFNPDILGDALEEWMAQSSLLRRSFRHCAVVAGLIERKHPGQQKSGKQVMFNSDLIFDVLRRYDPDHLLLQAARQEAADTLLDLNRLQRALQRFDGKYLLKELDQVSPFAVPLLLEANKQIVFGEGREEILKEAADSLIADAGGAALNDADLEAVLDLPL